MSIHFYKNGDTKKALFVLTDEHYELLNPAFETFHTKTGIYIDPYGTTRLYPENLGLIKELLKEKFKTDKSPLINELTEFLSKSIDENVLIIASGD